MKKPIVLASPAAIERKYRRFVRLIVGTMENELMPKLKNIFLKKDDISEQENQTDDVLTIIALLLLWWRDYLPNLNLFTLILFNDVNKFNDEQFIKMIKNISGLTILSSQSLPYKFSELISPPTEIENIFGENIDIYRRDDFLPLIKKSWLENQNTLIDQDIKKFILDAEIYLKNAIIASISLSIIRKQLNDLLYKLTNKLELLAVKQINNLDSTLLKFRQLAFGGKEYYWSTRLDERVRGRPGGKYPKAKPSHWAREGELFKWIDPPLGGHPGEAPGCRCKAIMRMPIKIA